MNTADLEQKLSLTRLAGAGAERELDGCYCGDLLSWVMGRAGEANIWITVMGNVNSIAVAKLADIGCIILCEGSHLDEDAKKQADINGIPVFSSEIPAYPLALMIKDFYAGEL
ncbi:MAG: hypothetical protein FWH02_06610 [Oscillospiraceae bacterium]|nr:hypothetical protein [Oscillospiraceae bacterium]